MFDYFVLFQVFIECYVKFVEGKKSIAIGFLLKDFSNDDSIFCSINLLPWFYNKNKLQERVLPLLFITIINLILHTRIIFRYVLNCTILNNNIIHKL